MNEYLYFLPYTDQPFKLCNFYQKGGAFKNKGAPKSDGLYFLLLDLGPIIFTVLVFPPNMLGYLLIEC